MISYVHNQGGGQCIQVHPIHCPRGHSGCHLAHPESSQDSLYTAPPIKSLGRRWRSALGIRGGTRQGQGDKTRLLSQRHVKATPTLQTGEGWGMACLCQPKLDMCPLPCLVYCPPGAEAGGDAALGSRSSPLPVQGQVCKAKGRGVAA